MDQLVNAIAADVASLLAPPDALIVSSALIKSVAATDDLVSLSNDQINAIRTAPELAAAFGALSGVDRDGSEVAIGTVRLRQSGDERTAQAERSINNLAESSQGPLRVSSVSPVVIEDEYKRATESGMGLLSA